MATSRGVGFSAMATMLLVQGRARYAEMEGRADSAMEHKPDPESGKGTDDLRRLIGTKRKRGKNKSKVN